MANRNDSPAARGVAERSKAAEESALELERRLAASKPTPTQRENDLAKVGALDIDDKEPDGSPLEGDAPDTGDKHKSVEADASGTYRTRAASSKKPE